MEPINSNTRNKNCTESISSDCVPYAGPSIPCISVCKGASTSEVIYQEGAVICSLISQLNSLTPIPVEVPPVIDFTKLDLGCLYSPTITTYSCPIGQTFVPDSSAFPVNGTPGYCQSCSSAGCVITTAVPTSSGSIPNPVPPPTSLLGILQLIISKIPCCDPCSGVNHLPSP